MLSGKVRPDAVFCISDVFASAVIKAAGQLGLSVPEDVAVMGFDNVALCNMTIPTISTVSQPMYQLGVAKQQSADRSAGGNPCGFQTYRLNTDIIVRKST